MEFVSKEIVLVYRKAEDKRMMKWPLNGDWKSLLYIDIHQDIAWKLKQDESIVGHCTGGTTAQ